MRISGYVTYRDRRTANLMQTDRFRLIFGYGKPPPLVKVVLQKGAGRGDTAYIIYG